MKHSPLVLVFLGLVICTGFVCFGQNCTEGSLFCFVFFVLFFFFCFFFFFVLFFLFCFFLFCFYFLNFPSLLFDSFLIFSARFFAALLDLYDLTSGPLWKKRNDWVSFLLLFSSCGFIFYCFLIVFVLFYFVFRVMEIPVQSHGLALFVMEVM